MYSNEFRKRSNIYYQAAFDLLLEYGTDVNKANNRGESPYIIAIIREQYESATKIKEATGFILSENDKTKLNKLFHQEISKDQNNLNLEKIKTLLQVGAGVNSVDINSNTALIKLMEKIEPEYNRPLSKLDL